MSDPTCVTCGSHLTPPRLQSIDHVAWSDACACTTRKACPASDCGSKQPSDGDLLKRASSIYAKALGDHFARLNQVRRAAFRRTMLDGLADEIEGVEAPTKADMLALASAIRRIAR